MHSIAPSSTFFSRFKPLKSSADTLALLSICVLLALWTPTFWQLRPAWFENADYGGLYIVLLFALFSFWQRKERWDGLPLRPFRGAWFIVAGLAAAALWMASGFPRISMACLPATLAMLVLAIYGWQRLRLILPVLTYSLLVVPPPDGLWAELTLFMRFLSTESARLFLHLLPIDLVRIEEFSIVLPLTDRRLMIADECSGVRSLLSLTTVGLWLIMDARCRNALKPLLALAIPLIAHTVNTLRISFTVLLYSAELDQFAGGEYHRWTGYLAIGAGLGILLAMIRWSERLAPRKTTNR